MKFSQLVDTMVINKKNGEKLGEVSDLLFDGKNGDIVAILIENNILLHRKKVIPYKDILKITAHNIFVKDENCVLSLEHFSNVRDLKFFKDSYFDKPIYTGKNDYVGRISDGIFNMEIGVLNDFEITDGVVQDIMEGRKIIEYSNNVKSLKNKIFCSSKNIKSQSNIN